jgi:hypothetical protein
MTSKEFDIQVGQSVIHKFYLYWPGARTMSFTQLLDTLKARKPMGGTAFLEGIGFGVQAAQMSDSKIDSAMRQLAINSRGKIPQNNMDFFSYLSNESTKINFVDAAVYTAVETAKDLATGAQAIGDQLIFTGKILNFLLPAILLFIVLFYVNKSTDGSLVRVAKGLRK